MNISDGETIPSEDAETVMVAGEFAELIAGVSYQSGSNDYHRNELVIQRIIDRCGMEIAGIWVTEWSEIAPGIITRRDKDSEAQLVRIYRLACPVHVKLLKVSEYICYDYPGDITEYEFWLRYVSAP